MTSTLRTMLLLCLVVAACSGDEGPAVPFKLGEADQPTDTPTADPAVPEVVPVAAAAASRVFAADTRVVEINDTRLELSNAAFRIALPIDLGADSELDVLAITVSAQGVVALQRAMHAQRNVTLVAPLHTLGKGCVVSDSNMQLTALSVSHVFATIEVACSTSGADPTTTTQPSETTLTSMHWLLSTEASPRVMERFSVLPPSAGGPATTKLGLSARGENVDADQNIDVVILLTYAGTSGVERQVPLRWLNRVGGLDRDRHEPEATFAAMLTAARRLQNSRAAFLAALEDIVIGHDLLCAESGHARISIGGRAGIACGRSAAIGSALALIARDQIEHAGDTADSLLAALAALEKLSDPGLTVAPADRTAAEQALKAIAAATRWQWQPGPSITEVRAPDVRLPALAFVDDHTLLLRGATQQSYDITTDTLTTVNEAPADLLLRDASGRLAVVAVERQCDGDRLKVVRAAQVVGGIVLGQSVVEPLIEARSAPPNARCDQPRPTHRGPSDGRWIPIGWTSSGIVLSSRRKVHTLPLDAMTHALGVAVPAALPLPAPVAAGAIAPDGSAHATLTSVGIFVTSVGGKASLIEPLGPVSARDVAVAPNAARLAYVFGGRVFIGTPPSAAP